MQVQQVTVTPELAENWLTRNTKNRPLSKAHVSRLADSMSRGLWSINGDTIAFDDSGRLIDGQHRLAAVQRSGVPINTLVVVGVDDPRAFKTKDTGGKARGPTDVAAMAGMKNAKDKTATARKVLLWDRCSTMRDFMTAAFGSSAFVTAEEIADHAAAIEHEIDAAMDVISKRVLLMVNSNTSLVSAGVILNRLDPVETQAFFNKVRTGIVDDEKDPALSYRDRLMTWKSSPGRSDRHKNMLLFVFTVKAWNYHKLGKPMTMLRFREEGNKPESYPVPIGSNKK